jgi:hypothetical protein
MADAAEQALRAADAQRAVEQGAEPSAPEPSIRTEQQPAAFDLMPADEPVRAAPMESLTPQADVTFHNLYTLPKEELEHLAKTAPRESQVDDGVTTREQAQEVLREHQDYDSFSTDNLVDVIRRTLVENRQRDWIQRVKEGRGLTEQQASFVRLGGAMAALQKRGEMGGLGKKLTDNLIEHGWSPHDAAEVMQSRVANLEAAGRRQLPTPAERPPEDIPSEVRTQPHEAPIEADRHLAREAPFDHPTDKAPLAQIESIAHDLRLAVEAEPDALFRVGDGETERSLSEILADLDAEDAAIAAVKACL